MPRRGRAVAVRCRFGVAPWPAAGPSVPADTPIGLEWPVPSDGTRRPVDAVNAVLSNRAWGNAVARWPTGSWLLALLGIVVALGPATAGPSPARAAIRYSILAPIVPIRVYEPGGTARRPPGGPVFGVYPGGGTGEAPDVPSPDPRAVMTRLGELSGGRPLVVHLYTAWSWYDPTYLDAEIARFGGAGYGVALSVKYAPPAGHEGDVAGYEAFVRALVRRHAVQPGVVSFVIGNEANQSGNPDASDGAFPGAREAVVRGTIAAREEIAQLDATARVGFNFAWSGSADADAAFLAELTRTDGPEFERAAQFVGVSLYPGTWGPGTGRPYDDMLGALASARASVDAVPGLRGLPLELLEVGAPMLDETSQAAWLEGFVRAAVDARDRLAITHLSWFDLWDSDSRSTAFHHHYGLLRTDLSPKPAFQAYRDLIAAADPPPGE